MTASPVGCSGVSGPVDGRSVGEIRADLARCDRDGTPWPQAARRLVADVPQLLAEVEAAHRFEDSAAAESAGLANRLNGVAAERDSLLAEAQGLRRELTAVGEAFDDLTDSWHELAAERDSLRGVVQAQQVRLAAVEALLPWSDEEFPIFPYQLREALGAEESDFLLIPRAALAAAADAPQPQDDPDEAESKRQWADYQSGRWCGECRFEHVEDPPCCYGPSPAVLPEKEQRDV